MNTIKTTLILLFLSFAVTGFTQVPDLHPTRVSTFPNLNPEYLAAFALRQARFEELERMLQADKVEFRDLEREDREIMEDEMRMYTGPFITQEPGCSWYCAGSPDTLTASSILPPGRLSDYEAGNAHDFDLRTAWVEGEPGYGEGAELTVSFDMAEILAWTEITVYNGYCKSQKVWEENSRVKTLLALVDGEPVATLHLEDTWKGQMFPLGSYAGKSTLTLRILEVYPGTKYSDTAISEVNFNGTGDH